MSSTRCIPARSPTATATAPATSRASAHDFRTSRALGVDAIWISPWYPSPLNDGGYDVADYRDIDPRFGTLADAEALIAEAHEHGIRVIVDLVPNHTSSEHRGSRQRSPRTGVARSAIATCSGRAWARTVVNRPTTGPPCSAVPRGRASTTASGTCTCSTRANPISTGTTRRFEPSSTTSSDSGSTGGSTASGSTSHTAWSKTRRSPTSNEPNASSRAFEPLITRTGTGWGSTT